MISYKLAEQLKEAGFPFSTLMGCKKFVNEGGTIFKYGQIPPETGQNTEIPTLSELIDACEIEDDERFEMGKDKDSNVWYACMGGQISGKCGVALSPEEAVAKLWLKLQNNNN